MLLVSRSISKTALQSDILIPTRLGYTNNPTIEAPAWSARTSKIFWRGGGTGSLTTLDNPKQHHYSATVRYRLHNLTNDMREADVRILMSADDKVIERTVQQTDITEGWYDVGLSGVTQCYEAACEKMRKEYKMKGYVSPENALVCEYSWSLMRKVC